MKTIADYYKNRFNSNELRRKNKIWKSLYKYFFINYISKRDTIMDIGAGYCELINNVKCHRKIAIDINPDTKKFANNDVEVFNYQLNKIEKIFSNKIDVVFFSNFFEHLNSKEEIIRYIEVSYNILNSDGKIIIMQPNIDLVGGKYWDFIDHKQPLTIPSLVEALEINDFKVKKSIKRFLPFTTKTISPVFNWMIYLYLKAPAFLRFGAGQSLIVAMK